MRYLRSRVWAPSLLTVVMVGVIASCSSSSPSTTTTTKPSSPALESKVLALSDLPTGWAVDNSSPTGTQASCLKDASDATTSGATATATAKFVKGTSLPALAQQLAQLPSDRVDGNYTKATSILSGCKALSGEFVTGTIGTLSFPTIGDASSAYLVTLVSRGLKAGANFLVFRKGDYVSDLYFAQIGTPSTAMTQQFAETAAARL